LSVRIEVRAGQQWVTLVTAGVTHYQLSQSIGAYLSRRSETWWERVPTPSARPRQALCSATLIQVF
jgi:hypothetical protein